MGPGFKATLRGLALSALVPAVVAAVISPFLGVGVFLGAFVLATLVAFPILVLFEQRFVTTAWMACLGGFLLGISTATLMFLPQSYPEVVTTGGTAWNGFFIICAVFGITGVPAGWVLWYHVSKYSNRTPKRPDDSATVA